MGAPSSSGAGSRAAAISPPSRRPYVSLRPGSRFQDLYREGARRRVAGIVVVQAPGTTGRPEVGIVAGRRVGNAVQRNRAKRRLREAAARVPLQPGTAYVLIASAQVVDVPFPRLVTWLGRAVAGEGSADEEDE